MAANKQILKKFQQILSSAFGSKDISVVFFVVAILTIIIVPLPSFMLDGMLSLSLALSILIILIGLYIKKPTDFSAFPTLLLLVTLYRLALNIATTRMILSEGYKGPEAVSSIITAFGEFVIGGNYVIGVIIFCILVLVNLMVVTNGSTRVTEVKARFQLDSLPGKQMAIDADMNAGLIDEHEAKRRRDALAQEADFYGAMDGASKFVKGDAIAGIIITVVNILGGFLIGMIEYNMSFSDSLQTFTILTIGDGLVGQIPALIVSTATGIIITRSTKGEDDNFAKDLVEQLVDNQKIVTILGAILFVTALIPGFPHGSLIFLSFVFFALAYLMGEGEKKSIFAFLGSVFKKKEEEFVPAEQKPIDIASHSAPARPQKSEEEIEREEEAIINDVLKVEVLELFLGYQLIKLADVKQNGDLIERIRGIRKKIASDFGFLVPKIRIKDNLQLSPTHYEFFLKGVKIGEGDVMPDHFLAMDTGYVGSQIEGIPTKEPAFGMDALWIEAKDKEEAIIQGYTIIDPSTVISTHISELIKQYAPEFITKDEVKKLLNRLNDVYPAIIEEANKLPTGVIRQVLQELLKEKIPIRDMLTILECVTDIAQAVQNNIPIIVEQVRTRLARTITNLFKSDDGSIKLLIFANETEHILITKIKEQGSSSTLLLTINETQKLKDAIEESMLKVVQMGISPVILLVDNQLRRPLYEKMEQYKIDVVVLSHTELDSNVNFEIVDKPIEIDFKG
ncbi:flagellar biosynthesis protein FlhA [uncultured Helicobacter sp.]|uniref:flagellar biosynthesis protein FlhA n=1 Tax=uncultured Helicobacter sp. TaxID=175537 RepID=UPI0026166071|nr:flagellar biosynthesis protein FlhA [uncultured Helicobacter sp.]